MSEMVERVAKALREELQNIGYGVGTINAGQLSDALARTAIEAMREPSVPMKIAGAHVHDQRPSEVALVWQVMNDAALKS